MDIVLHRAFGGFMLSEADLSRLAELGMELDAEDFHDWKDYRTNPTFVQIVREAQDRTDKRYRNLAIYALSTGQQYIVSEYDGREHLTTPVDILWETAT